MYKVTHLEKGVMYEGSMEECRKYIKDNNCLLTTKIDAIFDIANMNPKDPINPPHYQQGKIQCIQAIESATTDKTGFEGALVANIIKYLWRYESKGGLQDVLKARWYIGQLIDAVKEREENND